MSVLPITTTSHVTPEIAGYLRQVKLPRDPIIQGTLFSGYDPSKLPKSGLTFIVAGDPIQGVAIVGPSTIEKGRYLKLRVLTANRPQVIQSLVDETISRYKASSNRGLITVPLASNRPDRLLLDSGFKLTARTYLTALSKLQHNTTRSSSVQLIRYTRATRSAYRRKFIQSLTEHDVVTNTNLNRTFRRNVYPTRLASSKTHQVRLSYFVDGIVNDPQWYAFIVLINEEPVGFIKAQIPRHLTYAPIDLFLPKKFTDAYAPAVYRQFTEALPSSVVTHLGRYVTEADLSDRKLTQQLFGNPVAFSYHLF